MNHVNNENKRIFASSINSIYGNPMGIFVKC